VLGLDLAILDGRLRFFHGMAELFGSSDLIDRLTGMVGSLEAKAEQAEAKAEQAVVAGLREAVLALLDARGIACPDAARVLLMSENDPSIVRRWLSRAATAGSSAEIFSPEGR
jgi:hypothetical protein